MADGGDDDGRPGGCCETFGGCAIRSPGGVDMHRVILHSDMNAFYASVEQAERPEACAGGRRWQGGHEETRHGIVLAKSAQAKAAGVKTGEALWEARAKCPGLVVVPPRYDVYQRYSRLARRIYYDYTDLVEPFGLDERSGSTSPVVAAASAADAVRHGHRDQRPRQGGAGLHGVHWNLVEQDIRESSAAISASPMPSHTSRRRTTATSCGPHRRATFCTWAARRPASCIRRASRPSGTWRAPRPNSCAAAWGRWAWCCARSPAARTRRP